MCIYLTFFLLSLIIETNFWVFESPGGGGGRLRDSKYIFLSFLIMMPTANMHDVKKGVTSFHVGVGWGSKWLRQK